jgi:hypothetical protein
MACLLHGNMICGVCGEDLVVRVAADGHAEDEDLRRRVNRDLATATSLRLRSSTTSQRPGDLTA